MGPRYQAFILRRMGKNSLRIIAVEDNEDDRVLLELELKRAGIASSFSHVEERQEFLSELEKETPDIVLCDFSLPQFGAIEALKIMGEKAPEIPVLIVTGTLTDETAVECLKLGAVDYILKEKMVRLPSAIKNALNLQKSKKEAAVAEENLKKNQKRLEVITNVLPALLAYFDSDYIFQFCNQTYRDWFDKTDADIVGQPIQKILGARIFSSIKEKEVEFSKSGTLTFESTLEVKGSQRFVTVTLVQERGKTNGKIKGIACLITDISERKRYEDQLKSAKEEADSASRAKSQFLANISHEMRTPLNAIMGLSDLLLNDKPGVEDQRSWIERIGKNSEHLRKMIDEVLDLSAVEAGKLKINPTQFSIQQTIEQVRSLLFPIAKGKHINLNFEVDKNAPDQIVSDAIKLRQILINIVGNAIKFSDTGEVKVRYELLGKDGKIAFIVSDQGRGMTREEVGHLFEPFMQVDGSFTRKFGGTGLGLTLARKFAVALGGNVELTKSSPHEGSTFTISIDPGTCSQKTLNSEVNTTAVSTPVDLKSVRILVVEDAPENQYLIRRFLEAAGAEVDIAVEGQEGVQRALSKNFDLVLMDIQMPVLDGYQATSRLRMKGYQKPIVALTAHALDEERERCLKSGFDGFLTKPIHRLELLNQVSKYKVNHIEK